MCGGGCECAPRSVIWHEGTCLLPEMEGHTPETDAPLCSHVQHAQGWDLALQGLRSTDSICGYILLCGVLGTPFLGLTAY